MANVILLAAGDAAAVRGPSATVPGASLAPMPLTDGRYFLGTAVLDDPAHAAHHDRLAGLPVADFDALADFLPGVED